MPKVSCKSGIELCYESFGEGEPLLLIMGIGAQMVLWDEEFCRALAAQGFRVIRYDNRDCGESSQLDQLPMTSPRQVIARRLLGRPVEVAYTLDDMADDAAGLLDALGIDAAHIVGLSLGGMIAQCMVLRHPSRVRSLALIMSNPGEVWSNVPEREAFKALLAKVGSTRESAVARQVNLFRVLGRDPHRTPEARVRALAELHHDRGVYPRGFMRQFTAMLASPGRLRALGRVRTPTVVIHGASDPLLHPLGGRLLGAAIPDAELHMLRDMGHDMGPSLWPYIIKALVDNSRRTLSREPRKRRLRAWLARPIRVSTQG